VFAFDSFEMQGIAPDIIEYKLCVDMNHKPVIQTRRQLGAKRNAASSAKVQRLSELRLIRECQYPKWVLNVFLVKKLNGTWRMYVNFTDLNRYALRIVIYCGR